MLVVSPVDQFQNQTAIDLIMLLLLFSSAYKPKSWTTRTTTGCKYFGYIRNSSNALP